MAVLVGSISVLICDAQASVFQRQRKHRNVIGVAKTGLRFAGIQKVLVRISDHEPGNFYITQYKATKCVAFKAALRLNIANCRDNECMC